MRWRRETRGGASAADGAGGVKEKAMFPPMFKAEIPRRYRARFEVASRYGEWKTNYILIGAHGAVNLHFSGPHVYDGREHWSAGIEFHWRTPRDDTPPSHDACWLLECPCWHDGSSTWAQEKYLPLFLEGLHDLIWARLINDADEKLAP